MSHYPPIIEPMVNALTGPTQGTQVNNSPHHAELETPIQPGGYSRTGGHLRCVLPRFSVVLGVLKCVLKLTNIAFTRYKFATSSTTQRDLAAASYSCHIIRSPPTPLLAPPLIEGCGQMAYGYFTTIDHRHVTHQRARREIGSGDAGEGGKRGGSGMERESMEVGRRVFVPPLLSAAIPPAIVGGDFSFERGCMNPTCCPRSFPV